MIALATSGSTNTIAMRFQTSFPSVARLGTLVLICRVARQLFVMDFVLTGGTRREFCGDKLAGIF